MVKRLSNRWMGRVGVLVEQRARALRQRRRACTTPTATRRRRSTEPLEGRRPVRAAERRQRRRAASTSTRSGSSTPTRCTRRRTGIEVSGNVFGRQGYPYPARSGRARRRRSAPTRRCQVLVTPEIDYVPLRQPVEHRPARGAHVQGERGDVPRHRRRVQRVQREHRCSCGTTTSRRRRFNALAQNLSPRIFRVGLVVGF